MNWRNDTVAIAFFGIPRSIFFTKESIENNILDPIKSKYSAKIYSHFIKQDKIINPRTNEFLDLSNFDYNSIKSDFFNFTSEFDPNLQTYFNNLKNFGDIHNDNYRSLGNLIKQLYTLEKLTSEIELGGHEICVFVRPDLKYYDPLITVVRTALDCSFDTVFLPEWQPWRGLNDRFAVCVGKDAIKAYGKRILLAEAYCKHAMSPLNSHRLLDYSMRENNIIVKKIQSRASRVRANGVEVHEDFSLPSQLPIYYRLKNSFYEFGVRFTEMTRTKRVLRELGYRIKANVSSKI